MLKKQVRLILFVVSISSAAIGLVTPTSAGQDVTQTSGCFCVGTVGNINCDYADRVSLSDLILLIDHLYISRIRLPNREEANIDGDPDGVIDIADVIVLVDHLFINGVPLPLCPAPPNSPPETRIVGLIPDLLFINSVAPGAPTTGVFLSWSADDLIDHPYYPPPFEFEYRLYGPYPDALFEQVRNSFMIAVFHTNDGELLEMGLPPDTVACDTLYVDGQIDTIICQTLGTHYVICDTTWDGGVREINCDTVLVDTLLSETDYGRIDTLFDVEDPAFLNNPDYHRLAALSLESGDTWTYHTTDTLYSLFVSFPSDTTQLMNFIFWVRARDPVDSTLYDPTPAIAELAVIDPRFERDLIVLNWTSQAHENRALSDTLPYYWERKIDSWIETSFQGGIVTFDRTRDYVYADNLYQNATLLESVLRYKVLILIQDAAVSGSWSVRAVVSQQILIAIATGSNVWVATRVPLGNHPFGGFTAIDYASPDYNYFFGVEQAVFSGWGQFLLQIDDGYGYGLPRIEDFVGAVSENTTLWPDLTIDTASLRTRYDWRGSLDPPIFPFYPYLAEIGALPEVGWAQPSAEAEVMYRYRSLYGDVHPIVPELSFNGNPVMHRLDRGWFRTVHAMFTPLALEEIGAQQMVNAVLDWLYNPHLAQPVSAGQSRRSYTDAATGELRQWYLNWRQRFADKSIRHHNLSEGER